MPNLYRVGGCVRDELLGVSSKDIDFTFVLDDLSLSVEDGFLSMENWMKEQGFQIFLSTPEMFTVRAKFPKGDPNEGLVADFVMARKEIGYKPDSRKPILSLGSIEDDLIRRDFTLNAMAVNEDGDLIDLFGGRRDLERRILRTPLPAEQTMMDDPLRLLRCWRFSITKGFTIDEKILAAINNPEILKKLDTVVSKERIREELLKMFKHDTIKTLHLLHEMELLIPNLFEILFSKGLHLEPTMRR